MVGCISNNDNSSSKTVFNEHLIRLNALHNSTLLFFKTSTLTKILVLFLLFRWGNRSRESLSRLPTVIRLVYREQSWNLNLHLPNLRPLNCLICTLSLRWLDLLKVCTWAFSDETDFTFPVTVPLWNNLYSCRHSILILAGKWVLPLIFVTVSPFSRNPFCV